MGNGLSVALCLAKWLFLLLNRLLLWLLLFHISLVAIIIIIVVVIIKLLFFVRELIEVMLLLGILLAISRSLRLLRLKWVSKPPVLAKGLLLRKTILATDALRVLF